MSALARSQSPLENEDEISARHTTQQVEQVQTKQTREVCIQTEKSYNHERSRFREGSHGHVTVKEGPLLKLCSGGPERLVRDVRVQSQTSCVKENRVRYGFAVVVMVENKIGNLRTLSANEATAEGERIRRL